MKITQNFKKNILYIPGYSLPASVVHHGDVLVLQHPEVGCGSLDAIFLNANQL